jgi:hypothetical protein
MPSTPSTFLISILCVLTGRWVDPGRAVVTVSAPADEAAVGNSEFNCSCVCPVLAPARTVVVSEQLEPSWAACGRWLWAGAVLQWACCRVLRLSRALFAAWSHRPELLPSAPEADCEPLEIIKLIPGSAKPSGGPRTPSQLRIRHG